MSVMSIYLATAAALLVEVRVLFYSIRDGEKCRFQERTTHVAIHTIARFRQTSIQYAEWDLRQQTMWLKTDIHRFLTPNGSKWSIYGRSSFDAVLHLRIDIYILFRWKWIWEKWVDSFDQCTVSVNCVVQVKQTKELFCFDPFNLVRFGTSGGNGSARLAETSLGR